MLSPTVAVRKNETDNERILNKSRGSSVSIVTRLRAGRLGFNPRQGQ
jgi:hypothetical protein